MPRQSYNLDEPKDSSGMITNDKLDTIINQNNAILDAVKEDKGGEQSSPFQQLTAKIEELIFGKSPSKDSTNGTGEAGSSGFFKNLEHMFEGFFKNIKETLFPELVKNLPKQEGIKQSVGKESQVETEQPQIRIPEAKDTTQQSIQQVVQLEQQKTSIAKLEEDEIEDSVSGRGQGKQQETVEYHKQEKETSGVLDSLNKLISGKGTGGGAAAGEAEAAAGGLELADLLPLLALNTGGTTNATEFYVGEGPGGLDNPNTDTIEKVVNPTGAPIQVLNASQMGIDNSPGFSRGTIDKDLPGYASGTQAGQIGATIASGGQFSNPNQIIGGVSQGAATAASMIPIIGDQISDLIIQMEYLVQSIVDVIEGFNKLAESIGRYSGEIKMAEAEVHVAQIQRDLETSEDIGPQLASLYKDSNMIWIDIQKILRTISEPFLDMIVPAMHSLKEFMDDATPAIRGSIDALSIIVAWLYKWSNFGIPDVDDYVDRKIEEIKRHFSKKGKAPFVSDLGAAAFAAGHTGVNIRLPGRNPNIP